MVVQYCIYYCYYILFVCLFVVCFVVVCVTTCLLSNAVCLSASQLSGEKDKWRLNFGGGFLGELYFQKSCFSENARSRVNFGFVIWRMIFPKKHRVFHSEKESDIVIADTVVHIICTYLHTVWTGRQ
jgi:hypothetical protein